MDEIKPWYLSRTIWASLLVIVSVVAAATGIPLEQGDTDAVAEAILQAITAIAGVVAIVGRLFARARIV